MGMHDLHNRTMKRIAIAQNMRDEGMTYSAIGLELNVARETVRRWLNPSVRAKNRAVEAAYRATHKAQRKARGVTYRTTHRDESAAYCASHRAEAKARSVSYYATHRAEATAQAAAYRASHRVEVKARAAAYYAAHLDEEKERAAAWRKKHPDKCSGYTAMRRALKMGTLVGATISQLAEITEIYRRAKEDPKVRCYLCGKLIPLGHRHVDHITPLSKGGAHRPSNLAVACDTCNDSKGSKMPGEVGVLL